MAMEKWEKLLYYPLIGFVVIGALAALVWVYVVQKDFSDHGPSEEPETASVTPSAPSSGQKAEVSGPRKAPPKGIPASERPKPSPRGTEPEKEEPAIPGIRPINKSPQDELRTDKGTYERAADISEGDECYLAEYTNVRVKGPRTVPVLVSPDKSHIRWKAKLGGSVSGVPVVYGDRLYFGCYDYQMLCLEKDTGKLVFQAKTPSQAIGSLQKYGSNIIVPQRNGHLSAFDVGSGNRSWNHRIAVDKPKDEIDVSISGITLIGSNIYVSKHWGSLYILSATKGQMKAVANLPYESRINLPAMAMKGDLVFCNVAGEIMCFDMMGSSSKWKYQIEHGYPVTMRYSGGKLLVATSDKEFFAMDPDTKETAWSTYTSGWAFDALTAKDGAIYLAAGSLYAMNAKDGSTIWERKSTGARGFCRGDPVVEKDVVFACEEEGVLRKIERSSGKVLQNYEVGGVVRNGILKDGNLVYVSTIDKELIAVDVSK